MGAHVPSSPGAARPRTQQVSRAVLVAALLVIALWVIRDFIPAIAWACVIAIAMWPMLKRFESHRLFRNRPTLIALVITAAISLLVVLPVAVAATQAIGRCDLREWLRTIQDNGIPVPDVVARLPYGAAQITEWWQANLAHPLHRPPRCTASTARNSSRSAGSSAPSSRTRCSNSASCSSRCS